jgi:hypothetical protein
MQAVHFALAAIAIWLVPFMTSTPFFDRDGNLKANLIIFKICMAVVLSIVTYVVARWYFGKYAPSSYGVATASLVGFSIVSIIIDQFTIMKMSNISTSTYIAQVVSIYTLIVLIGLLTAKGRIG